MPLWLSEACRNGESDSSCSAFVILQFCKKRLTKKSFVHYAIFLTEPIPPLFVSGLSKQRHILFISTSHLLLSKQKNMFSEENINSNQDQDVMIPTEKLTFPQGHHPITYLVYSDTQLNGTATTTNAECIEILAQSSNNANCRLEQARIQSHGQCFSLSLKIPQPAPKTLTSFYWRICLPESFEFRGGKGGATVSFTSSSRTIKRSAR